MSMSMFFQRNGDGLTLWNPALRVGQVFHAYVRAVEKAIEADSGMSEEGISDEVAVDSGALQAFVLSLSEQIKTSNHTVLILELEPVLLICAALLLRSEGSSAVVPADVKERATALLASMPV